MNPKVDEYLDKKANDWQRPIMDQLRSCILSCGLTEDVKWGGPVYVHHGNVLGMGAFKKHIALWFFEGAILKDEAKVLHSASEGTNALRQWHFKQGDVVNEELLRTYVAEAALNMEKGIRTPKKKIEVVVAKLLQDALDAEPNVKAFFNSMAPSHRKEYANHIAEAKQEATQIRRLEKCMNMLREGKGLHDKYKEC